MDSIPFPFLLCGGESMIILIDGNNLGYRAEYSVGYLTNKNDERVGCMYGFIDTLYSYLRPSRSNNINPLEKALKTQNIAFEGISRVFVFFDGGDSKFRKAIFEDYKGQRREAREKETDEEKANRRRFNKQLGILRDVLPSWGVKTFQIQGWESDDLIYGATRLLNEKAVIISADKDMLQLLSENIYVYSPVKDILYTLENFESYMNVPHKYYLDYRILVGDTSDNIKGIHGIGDKKAKKLIEQYGSITNMLRHDMELRKSKVNSRILDNLDIIQRNNRLMNLNKIPFETIEGYLRTNISIDESFHIDEVKEFLISNSMTGLLRELMSIKQTFGKLH